MTSPLRDWLWAFAFTEAVEVPITCAFLRGKLWRRVAIAAGASALTHPAVWFAFPRLPLGYWPMVGAAEAFALIAEAGYLALWLAPRRALIASALANGSSLALGLLCRACFGWP